MGARTRLVAACDLNNGSKVGDCDRPCGCGEVVDEVGQAGAAEGPVARNGNGEIGGADHGVGHTYALTHVLDGWLLDCGLQRSTCGQRSCEFPGTFFWYGGISSLNSVLCLDTMISVSSLVCCHA